VITREAGRGNADGKREQKFVADAQADFVLFDHYPDDVFTQYIFRVPV
jgi:hypothetical protein